MSRRTFQFSEGSSHKFWTIEVDGPRFTVQFGRIGTTGQTQTKEFASDALARQAADKLIAEKTRKGYTEVTAAPTAAPPPPAPAATPSRAKAAEPAAPAAPVALQIIRRVDVDPPEWLLVPGQPWRSRPRPEPAPFDREACFDRLGRAAGDQVTWRTDWNKLHIAPALTRAEAQFWLEVLTRASQSHKTADLVAELRRIDYDKPLTAEEVIARLQGWEGYGRPQLALPLSNLLTHEQYLHLILDPPSAQNKRFHTPSTLLPGFREYILPYLTEAEAEALRAVVRPFLDPNDTSNQSWYIRCLAAYLGMREELSVIIAGWPDGQFARAYFHMTECWETAHVMVFNLADDRLVEAEARRLGLLLPTPEAVAAWLVRTHWHALDRVRDSVLALSQKDRAEKLTKVLAWVQTPEVAPVMLQLSLESKAAGPARQWLDDHPGNAIAGLIPVAAGQGKLAQAAVEYLRLAAKKGFTDFITAQLEAVPGEVAARVREAVLEREEKVYPLLDANTTPPALRDALAGAPKPTPLVGWASPANLPPLLVGELRLSDEQVLAVLAALHRPRAVPDPLLGAVKEHADRAALDTFVWRLFELWLANGAPPREKWTLLALGHLGGDAVALKLTPLLRAWPGESQHQRAVAGLECLRAIGTDTALIQLNGIAQRLKFKGLQNKAREFMESIARDRNLTRDELEDRIVPDLDLDERGTRILDFGPRRFEVVLGPDLKPLVRDEERKLREDLPKPGVKDDEVKAKAAVAEWKVLKKALREAVKVQAYRLEQAMIVGRRWTPGEFQTLLVHHPLMVNLVRRLLWGGFDPKARLVRTFRVTEEREYAGPDDRLCTLEGLATVGVVHPLHLSAAERAKWGEVFADYEIIGPFQQLGRPIFGLEGDEEKKAEITRFAGKKIPGVSVASYLEKSGWQRGMLHDHGDFHEHYKHFPGANITAMAQYDGPLWASNIAEAEKIAVEKCTFWKGLLVTNWRWSQNAGKIQPLNLGEVDALVLSEVLADLSFLAARVE
jgi:predicted DNA-binding WGR domain protein